jgi:hypothetical protein
METIYTIDTDGVQAKLNKSEIDILHFVDSWLPTLTDWSVEEISHKCKLFTSDADDAVDMLILHGLLENAGSCPTTGRRVYVPELAALWMRENYETINSLYMMNDCDMFTEDETATA